MLAKLNRINKQTIEKLFQNGRVFHASNLSIRYIIDKNNEAPRTSFIAPKTISKNAVDRNLLKRRGRATLKKHITALPLGFVGVFVFGKKSFGTFGGNKNKSYNPVNNLNKEVKFLLDKIK